MEKFDLDSMIRGWFVGDFNPTAYSTQDCEVAVKTHKAGDFEASHHHKVATEITVFISGKAKMSHGECLSGDIIVLKPNESTSFLALEDCLTVVVKIPGAQNDKYLD